MRQAADSIDAASLQSLLMRKGAGTEETVNGVYVLRGCD